MLIWGKVPFRTQSANFGGVIAVLQTKNTKKMKKLKFLLIISLIALLGQVKGQNFAPENAEWYYNYIETGQSNPYSSGFIHIIVEKDTIIEMKVCKKLALNIMHPTGENEILNTPLITYYNNDTVFYKQGNIFYVLYNFNTNIGDSWVSRNPYEFFGMQIPENDTLTTYTVEDIENVNINGEVIKKYTLSSNSDWYFAGDIFQIIGSEHFMLPGIWSLIDPPMAGTLRCYNDDDFSYSTGIPCDTLITNLDKITNFNIKLYPNPISNNLVITTPINYTKIIIVDIKGNTVFIENDIIKSNSYIIDLSLLNSGLYFLVLYNANKIVKSSKIIKL